jgi:Rrf2 family protein
MISLSTKYAIRALIELTKLEKDQLIQVQELSERIQIPQPYLAKVVKSLAQKGFVFSRRGIHGGVRLEKKSFSG